jgi:hypothetical protein
MNHIYSEFVAKQSFLYFKIVWTIAISLGSLVLSYFALSNWIDFSPKTAVKASYLISIVSAYTTFSILL